MENADGLERPAKPRRRNPPAAKLRLDLRPHIDIEARLLLHLANQGRKPKALRIRELLEAGLGRAHPPSLAIPADGEPQEISADLNAKHDAPVLEALSSLPKRAYPAALRQWLLAGFYQYEAPSAAKPASASKQGPSASQISSPAVVPSASVAPLQPPQATPSLISVDVDLSDKEVAPPPLVAPASDGFAERFKVWQHTLAARDAAGDWAEGEREAHVKNRPVRADLLGLLG